MAKREIELPEYEITQYFNYENLEYVIAYLQSLEELKGDGVTIYVNLKVGGYDDEAEVWVTPVRLETDEEEAKRKGKEENLKKAVDARDRDEYERLKKKFGG